MNIFKNWDSIGNSNFEDGIYNLLVEQGGNLIEATGDKFSYFIDTTNQRISEGHRENKNIYKFNLKNLKNDSVLFLFEVSVTFEYPSDKVIYVTYLDDLDMLKTDSVDYSSLVTALYLLMNNSKFLKRIELFYWENPEPISTPTNLGIFDTFKIDKMIEGDKGNVLVITEGNIGSIGSEYFDIDQFGLKYIVDIDFIHNNRYDGFSIYKIENIKGVGFVDGRIKLLPNSVKFIDFNELDDNYNYYIVKKNTNDYRSTSGITYKVIHSFKSPPKKVIMIENMGGV